MNKRDMFLVGAAAGVVAGGLTWLITRVVTEPRGVVPLVIGEPFPTVSGTLLSGEPFTVPDDIAGDIGLLLLGWDYAARFDVEAWARFLMETYGEQPGLVTLEMPMISGVGPLMRKAIDAAMVRGTAPEERSHVLTIYGDLRGLRRRLSVTQPRHAQVFLLGRTGRVAWRASGPPTEELKTSITLALAAQGVEPRE